MKSVLVPLFAGLLSLSLCICTYSSREECVSISSLACAYSPGASPGKDKAKQELHEEHKKKKKEKKKLYLSDVAVVSRVLEDGGVFSFAAYRTGR